MIWSWNSEQRKGAPVKYLTFVYKSCYSCDFSNFSSFRKLERQRRKERVKKAKLDGVVLPISRKQLKHIKKDPVDVNVVIDSSFEEYMQQNDMKKLLKQIQHCYAINRRADHPFKVCTMYMLCISVLFTCKC